MSAIEAYSDGVGLYADSFKTKIDNKPISDLIIPDRDNLLKYKVLLNNEKELIFYIEDENEELFITKKIYKSKAELVKLISKLPKLK